MFTIISFMHGRQWRVHCRAHRTRAPHHPKKKNLKPVFAIRTHTLQVGEAKAKAERQRQQWRFLFQNSNSSLNSMPITFSNYLKKIKHLILCLSPPCTNTNNSPAVHHALRHQPTTEPPLHHTAVPNAESQKAHQRQQPGEPATSRQQQRQRQAATTYGSKAADSKAQAVGNVNCIINDW